MKNRTKLKSNILWITLDHVTFHQYKHMSGSLPVLKTYQSLCERGIEFTNCKSVHPLCGPARACMLSGLYTHKHKNYRNEKGLADQDIPLIDVYLKKHGYKMALLGKNHSGYEDLRHRGIDCINFSTYGSENNRINDEYGNPYMTPEYANYLKRNGLGKPIYHQEWHTESFGKFPDQDYDLTETDNFNSFTCGTLEPEKVHEVDFLIDEAKMWLEKNKENPFVLRLDTWGPHHAYQVPSDFADRFINAEEIELPQSFSMDTSKRPGFSQTFLQKMKEIIRLDTKNEWQHILKRAYESYSYIDMRLGELIEWLKEAGLGDRTAILFTADHGDGIATKGGIFDKCGDMQEELMEIPMVIYSPWMEGGRKNNSLTSNLDVVPTILDLLDLVVPDHMDGISLKALAEGKIPERKALMCEHYGHMENYYSQRALYSEGYKYIWTEDNPEQLFQISKDPFELNDLAQEPQMEERLGRMKELLRQEQKRYQDDEPVRQMRDKNGGRLTVDSKLRSEF